MLDVGSSVGRFTNDFQSAKAIVDVLIAVRREREVLLLQEELVDLKKHLIETHAGRMLYNTHQKLLDDQKAAMER